MEIDYTLLPEIPCPVCCERSYTILTNRFDGGRLVRCTLCNHIYLNPSLSDDMLETIYRDYHITSGDDTTMGRIETWYNDPEGPYQRALTIIEKYSKFSDKRVLEIGPGPGRFLYECHQRGATTIGLDISPESIRLAKKYYDLELLPLTLEDALQKGALQKGQFDLVFAFELIEHVRYPGKLISMIHDLLAPGGLVFISTPNFALFYLMQDIAPPVQAWQEHLHFFDPLTMAHLIHRHNLNVVGIGTLNPLSPEERQRQKIVANAGVMALWQQVRNIDLLRQVKKVAFNLLSRQRDSAKVISQAGMTLFCVAQRTA